ncbi:MAG: sodium:solute symporter family protein [Bacteroidota bacterium]
MANFSISLGFVDYLIILSYFVFALLIGVILKNIGSKSVRAYFLSDSKLSWWLLGTSMAATTFALDTPLRIAGWTRMEGIAKNWEDWVFLLGALFTSFFFSKLWRRTNVLNDAEFINLRYSGKPAAFLRGFRALYMGFIMNMLVIGVQLLAIAKIGALLFGITSASPNYELWKWGIAIVSGVTALSYCYLSGLSAIIYTDFVQFFLSLAGAIILAYFAVNHEAVGGLHGMVEHFKLYDPDKLNFMPPLKPAGIGKISLLVVIGYSAMRWWTQVYGGAEPGGQAHIAQRMLAAKTEKDSFFSTLWSSIASFGLKPLPWIITGLATIIIFPVASFSNHEEAYLATVNFVPTGLKGVVVASFFAAFMSTVDTRINLGASYFVNDFYRPFVDGTRTEKHYVKVGKAVSVAQILVALCMLFIVDNMRSFFYIYAGIGSGAGLVYILRFYWWRISAWSEIAAMSAALVCVIIFRWGVYGTDAEFTNHGFEYMFISFFAVTAFWLLVTFITKPTTPEKLKAFYRTVKPGGPLWRPIANELKAEGIKSPDNLKVAFVGWLFANPMIFGILFGVGGLLLGNVTNGIIWIGVSIVSGLITRWAVMHIADDK